MTEFLNLRDRVIVITGAASGMGRAIARAADREGARLVLSDADGDRLKATAGELAGDARHLRADVTRQPEVEAIVALAEREFGRMDGLVTCAGIITTSPSLEVTAEEWDRVFAVNARGTFFTVQAALKRMIPRGQGRIVTIGSDSYKLGGGRIANIPYAATKGAVVTMTKGFARMLVGTMVEIGLDRRPLADVETLLERGDNQETSAPAPPQGLYFVAATYPQDLYLDQPEEAHVAVDRG